MHESSEFQTQPSATSPPGGAGQITPPSEHFGWPEYYADEERFWARQGREQRELYRREEERRAERQAQAARAAIGKALLTEIAFLRKEGLLDAEELSYTKTAYLEFRTGIREGDHADFLAALREGYEKDMERKRSVVEDSRLRGMADRRATDHRGDKEVIHGAEA